jgi:hypothetical protein
MALTPSQRSQRARAAAYARHANDTGGNALRAANEARLRQFEEKVDPSGTLAPEERRKRALLARKAFMASIGLKASKARARR